MKTRRLVLFKGGKSLPYQRTIPSARHFSKEGNPSFEKVCRRYRKLKRTKRIKRSKRKYVGGMASVTAPATILTPAEQADMYLHPSYDDMRYNDLYMDSRTPFINIAMKQFTL